MEVLRKIDWIARETERVFGCGGRVWVYICVCVCVCVGACVGVCVTMLDEI